MSRRATLLLAVALAAGCAPRATEPETVSLLGEPLHAPPLSEPVRADRLAKLEQAQAAYERDSDDPDALIWLGRRTAYLGRYRRAVEIYTEGLRRHPRDSRLYRHRGHRYITLRRFDLAVADLERAAELIRGLPDVVEPDGLPNARGIPTSTSHSNIWYHLGLAYYLQGDFDNAARCYRECLAFSTNPDMLCATSYWLVLSLRRLGRDAEAARVLEPITPELEIIENETYHRLLLMYRGLSTPEQLLGKGEALAAATLGYGVAQWHLLEGREERGLALLERVVAGEPWAAFGYIAAEVELHRRGSVLR